MRHKTRFAFNQIVTKHLMRVGAYTRLNQETRIHSYVVESENFESIHNHSAYALIENTKHRHG